LQEQAVVTTSFKRSEIMIKRTLIAAIALTLTASAVHAEGNKLSKPEGAGMLTGAAAGAVVGGPVGAFVGMMIGGIMGDSIDQSQAAERRAQAIEEELLETRRELALASQRPQSSDSGEVMLAALAERMRADVMFRTNSAILDVPTQMQLKELGALLAQHPRLAIEVHGFADPRGKLQQNQALSLDRAEKVRSAILFGGAAAEQIQVSAHGEALVRAPKGDIEAYAWERRVSLVITPNANEQSTQGQVAQSR
jgi:outer membrane protein OmpA-like peptidoglycan-associated protein